jgi:hypothetical protein
VVLAGATAGPVSIGMPSNPSCPWLVLAEDVVFELPEELEVLEAFEPFAAEELVVVEDDEPLLPQAASSNPASNSSRTVRRWTRISRNGSDRACESRKWWW